MSYTTRSAIAAKIKTSLIVRACDDNEDGQEDAGAFAALQQDIDDEIDGILGASYEVPFVSAPAAVTAAAKVMLCELVYQKCATPEKENPWADHPLRGFVLLPTADKEQFLSFQTIAGNGVGRRANDIPMLI